ncbi:IclR family transcriptional regulator [Castellaniella sp. GW247-6E4]|uniref:IclR family transcriptional regulator n=1 Tax=Castellaniella sp. GW247-6E4 TaxID=3140380 RepID=UPI0033163C62
MLPASKSIAQPPAQTVGRAALLLRIIASSHNQSLRLVDIAKMASLDKSTAQRLLQRLVLERLAVRDPVRGYRLGPLIYELGLVALPGTNLREVSQPYLQTLAQSTGDMVFLVGRSGHESICLSRIAGNYPIQTMTRTEGDRHPLGVGAGGLAILASMSDAEIHLVLQAVEPRLQAYQTTPERILKSIDDARGRGGIAIDAGNAALDVTAIGRTVHDRGRAPVASVFVASIGDRMMDSRQKQVTRLLVDCVSSIEHVFR